MILDRTELIREKLIQLEKRNVSNKISEERQNAKILRDRLTPEEVENMGRIQSETFKNYIKKNYPSFIEMEPKLFEEFFTMILDEKLKNMVQFMEWKTGNAE
jgi:hypothetical protein